MTKTTAVHGADRRDRQRGFTLIELSIVLVIIGLLIGGVVKGQELIENARGNKVQQELQQVSTAILNYRTRFGESPIAATRFGAAGDGWRELRLAGLLDLPGVDDADDDSAPANSMNAGAAGFAMLAADDTDTIAEWDDGTILCAVDLPKAQAVGIASGMAPNIDNYTTGNLVRLQDTDETTATDISGDAVAPADGTDKMNVCIRLNT